MRLTFLAAVAAVLSPVLAIAQTAYEAPVAEGVPEIVVVTQASGPATSSLLPTKGMNKNSVARSFGQPANRRPAVGGGSRQQPPITRWDYDGFSVFFEYDHVVDTVQRGNPAPIAVYDGLAGGPR